MQLLMLLSLCVLSLTTHAQYLTKELFNTVAYGQESPISPNLLYAIALVESGGHKLVNKPWAWAVKSSVDSGQYFSSKQQAVAYVQMLRRNGITNIDVGPMQVNLRWHSKLFRSIDDALEPERNIKVAAQILSNQVTQHGLIDGIRRYHGLHAKTKWYLAAVIKNWQKMQ